MQKILKMLSAALIGMAALSCDKPYQYSQERPAIDQVDSEGHGLQSKDLLQATDQMAQELLALPALNQSQTRWTVVAAPMENQTVSQRENLDIFVDRLKTQLYKQGGDRIALIENRDRYRALQEHELDNPPAEQQATGSVQPQYVLYGAMQELANRDTSTYRAEFKLSNLRTREILWNGEYIVKVRR